MFFRPVSSISYSFALKMRLAAAVPASVAESGTREVMFRVAQWDAIRAIGTAWDCKY
jgi:hypothetical protein